MYQPLCPSLVSHTTCLYYAPRFVKEIGSFNNIKMTFYNTSCSLFTSLRTKVEKHKEPVFNIFTNLLASINFSSLWGIKFILFIRRSTGPLQRKYMILLVQCQLQDTKLVTYCVHLMVASCSHFTVYSLFHVRSCIMLYKEFVPQLIRSHLAVVNVE